jgi:hypothetical protein
VEAEVFTEDNITGTTSEYEMLIQVILNRANSGDSQHTTGAPAGADPFQSVLQGKDSKGAHQLEAYGTANYNAFKTYVST